MNSLSGSFIDYQGAGSEAVGRQTTTRVSPFEGPVQVSLKPTRGQPYRKEKRSRLGKPLTLHPDASLSVESLKGTTNWKGKDRCRTEAIKRRRSRLFEHQLLYLRLLIQLDQERPEKSWFYTSSWFWAYSSADILLVGNLDMKKKWIKWDEYYRYPTSSGGPLVLGEYPKA